MSKPICRSLTLLGALGLCSTLGACSDDPPPSKLFDETGVWSVVSYDLEGSGQLTEINTTNRRDAFMLSFDPSERVVTAASCIEPGNETPADSPCLISASTTEWQCRCFGYDFVEERMLWREFNAGDIPPVVSVSEIDAPPMEGGGGGSGTGGTDDGGGDGGSGGDSDIGTVVNVAEIMDVGSTFNFRPLPIDLFGSNGDNSRYVLQTRANSVFDTAFEDTERPTCTPCVP